jgi:hypothetical protein
LDRRWIETRENLHIPNHLRSVKLITIVNNGEWDWSVLNSWVPTDIKAKIASLLPSDMSNGADLQVTSHMEVKGS